MSSQLTLSFETSETPEEIFSRVLRRISVRHASRNVRVTFHPWAQVRSTIRFTETEVEVGISDMLADASPEALEALAEILICRITGRPPSRSARACYLACIMSPAMRERINRVRRTRGFKVIGPAKGRSVNLQEVFDRLNREYFQTQLRIRRIGWSRNPSWTILGHHDPAHETITISRRLDKPQAPRVLVEYVVFHEMLHIQYPVERNHHRRVIHSAAFRAAEKRFAHYNEASRLLKSGKWGGYAIT